MHLHFAKPASNGARADAASRGRGGRNSGGSGLTRTQINDLFGRNKSGDKIASALRLLLQHGKAKCEMVTTGKAGRPFEVWTVK